MNKINLNIVEVLVQRSAWRWRNIAAVPGQRLGHKSILSSSDVGRVLVAL